MSIGRSDVPPKGSARHQLYPTTAANPDPWAFEDFLESCGARMTSRQIVVMVLERIG
jgi:hypothetical protein